ncbi:MAG: CD225/dispanin family protein [Marinifilaceae bacterium]
MEEKKYFYSDGANRFGPFTLAELKLQNISRQTLVWYAGMAQWQKAGTIPELDSIFHLTPPPIDQEVNPGTRPIPPKTWLLESILVTLFCCLPFGIVGIVYATKVDSAYSRGEYDDAIRFSQQAARWTRIGFWIGLACAVVYLIIGMFGATVPFFYNR